jgi:hypothetical protein
MELRIDSEFQQMIPALSEDEFRQLEENILEEEMIINPLIVWNGVIVDGHNRFRIAQMHPEIPYSVHEKVFADRYAANAWICKNQLGRRNLTPEQKKYLIGKQYEAEKASHGGSRGNQYTKLPRGQKDQLATKINTRGKIALETNTNETYVRRAEEFAHGVDAAEEALPGIRQEILSGKIHPTAQAVAAVAGAPVEERPQLAEQLRKKKELPTKSPVKSHEKKKRAKAGLCEIPSTKQEPAPFMPTPNREEPEHPKPKKRISELDAIRAISAQMEITQGGCSIDDMLGELRDAVNTMINRWNICIRMYQEELESESNRQKVYPIAERGIQFLQKW